MSCGVGRRCSSDPLLLWLWCRLAAAALIQSLAWEFPYATGAALKRQKKKNLDHEITPVTSSGTEAILVFFFFVFSWAAPAAYGGSKARSQIGAVATSLHHSHSNEGSESRLQPTPQLTAELQFTHTYGYIQILGLTKLNDNLVLLVPIFFLHKQLFYRRLISPRQDLGKIFESVQQKK